jgi:hypothetical protein
VTQSRQHTKTQPMVERFLFIEASIIGKILAVRLRDCFEQRIKWNAPLELNFGLGLWRLHTMVA